MGCVPVPLTRHLTAAVSKYSSGTAGSREEVEVGKAERRSGREEQSLGHRSTLGTPGTPIEQVNGYSARGGCALILWARMLGFLDARHCVAGPVKCEPALAVALPQPTMHNMVKLALGD